MQVANTRSPFDGLEKGDLSLALASPFVERLKELVFRRALALQTDLSVKARLAIGTPDGELLQYVRAAGAQIAEATALQDLFQEAERYARSK